MSIAAKIIQLLKLLIGFSHLYRYNEENNSCCNGMKNRPEDKNAYRNSRRYTALCFKIFFIDFLIGVGISFSIAQEALEFPYNLIVLGITFCIEILKIMR